MQNKKNYVCLRGAQCPVTIATRKKCPACRFEKCLKTGMKLEGITSILSFNSNVQFNSLRINESTSCNCKEAPTLLKFFLNINFSIGNIVLSVLSDKKECIFSLFVQQSGRIELAAVVPRTSVRTPFPRASRPPRQSPQLPRPPLQRVRPLPIPIITTTINSISQSRALPRQRRYSTPRPCPQRVFLPCHCHWSNPRPRMT